MIDNQSIIWHSFSPNYSFEENRLLFHFLDKQLFDESK